MSAIQAATRRAQADEPFVEHARPDADPVGRGLEQPRHRRRGHFARRGRAVATTARPDDGVLVSLDIDLEQRGAALAVGGVELATTRTDARILRWFARFLLLPEAGALGAAVRHRAAGRACARCPASSAARSGCRRAPSTGRSGSSAACRVGLAASRPARSAPRSLPSGPVSRRAAFFSRSDAIVLSRASTRRLAAAIRRSNWLRSDSATRLPSRYTFATRARSRSCFSQLISFRWSVSIRSRRS